jgi:hypothetical protein
VIILRLLISPVILAFALLTVILFTVMGVMGWIAYGYSKITITLPTMK